MNDLDEYLEAIVAGDADAFGRWLARAEITLRESLRSFARKVDTEALIQETALLVWNLARGGHVASDGRGNSLLRLALRIARNKAIDMSRRRRRETFERAPEDDLLPGDIKDPSGVGTGHGSIDPDNLVDPRRDFSDPFVLERIRLCYGKLKGRLREALSTFIACADRMTTQEMAAKLGTLTPAAFRQNLTRARKAMADCLRANGVESW